MQPLLSHMKVIHVPRISPVRIVSTRTMWDSSADTSYEVDELYECLIRLELTGGSIEPFIKNFREVTEPIRHEIESTRFDEEVDKLLSDEYNQ